jgi:hypothetical protein
MTQQPIDYASPRNAEHGRPLGPALWLTGWLLFDAFAITIALGFITPGIEPVFKDFKVDLPGITKLFLLASRWFVNDYGWIWVWLLTIGMVCIVVVLRPPKRGPERSWAWVIVILLVRFAWVPLLVIAALALFIPYVNLIQSVSSPPKH